MSMTTSTPVPAGLTIRGLVSDPALGTRLLAGASGLDRPVLWAHASEIPDPDRWLGPHELLMTIGLCVPAGSSAQRRFIARLAEAGLAGMTIGDDGHAPHLTKALFAEADARDFPVLTTGGDVPFAVVGRTVAAANSERQTMGVLQLARLYQAVGRQDRSGRRSGAYLRDLFGADLSVVDDRTGCVIIGAGTLGPEATRSYALRSSRPTRLAVVGTADLESLTLAHLTQVLAVEATAILQSALAEVGAATRRLELALSGRTGAIQEVRRELDRDPEMGVLAVPITVPEQVALAIALAEIPVLGMSERRGVLAVAAPAGSLPALRRLLSALGSAAGVSAPHPRVEDLAGALEQAESELRLALTEGPAWREYRGAPLTLLTRSDTEARHAVDTVLGPLADPGPRATVLRTTLFALLDHDLRWGATADALGVHRQTLVHRMRRVEELTGRTVRSTAQLSELWLARTAWQRLGRDVDPAH